jgi:hypothetical protein
MQPPPQQQPVQQPVQQPTYQQQVQQPVYQQQPIQQPVYQQQPMQQPVYQQSAAQSAKISVPMIIAACIGLVALFLPFIDAGILSVSIMEVITEASPSLMVWLLLLGVIACPG